MPSEVIWSPQEYLKSAIIAKITAEELLSRFQWLTVDPKVILDLGCGTGMMLNGIAAHYDQAKVIGIDYSDLMINFVKQSTCFECVQADAANLPLKNNSVDMIIANLSLPWMSNLNQVLKEMRRILSTEGVLLMTTFGLDTGCEFENAIDWSPLRIDLHELGDLLIQQGFAEPVLDVDRFTLCYQEVDQCIFELISTGMIGNQNSNLFKEYLKQITSIEVTYELNYAQAFAPQKLSAITETKIPLSMLRRHLPKP